MKLLEHEAKTILQKFNIPVPQGALVYPDNEAPDAPVVLKSQVHTGGRGKAGGVQVIKDGDTTAAAADIFGLAIKGELPEALLAEELLDIAREHYLSLVINRERGVIELLAHPQGGVDIESQAGLRRWTLEGKVWTMDDSEINLDHTGLGESLAEEFAIPEQTFALQDLVANLLHCFNKSDATLLEINPLVVTIDGRLVAGDCKMELDDAAAWRHPEWQFAEAPQDANFVTLDPSGTVATMANGAGLAMATVDAVVAAGHRPANFLDIGGAATVASVTESFQRISNFANVRTIIINIFGGIVRCDTVAEAIIAARESLPAGVTLAVRLSGNRAEQADALLSQHGIAHHQSLEAILQELPS